MGLVETKVGEFSISEAFAIGLSKSLSEQLLAPVIGNGNYMSGATKLVLAWGLPKYMPGFKGNFGKTVATGLAVDGTEDIINSLFSDAFGQSKAEGGLLF